MRLPHVTPFSRAPIYFFTACTAARRPVLVGHEARACLLSIWTQSAERNGWFFANLDHVDAVLREGALRALAVAEQIGRARKASGLR
jgi:hypothetical protein